MTSKYEFDSERWLRNWSARKRFTLADGRDPFAMCADEIHNLRMAVDLHEQGAELMREEMMKLKKTARLLIITAQPVLGEDGHLWITEHAVDALAALVGEG